MLSTWPSTKYLLSDETSLGRIKGVIGVKCLVRHMGIAGAGIVGTRSSGKGCGGIRRGPGRGERQGEQTRAPRKRQLWEEAG